MAKVKVTNYRRNNKTTEQEKLDLKRDLEELYAKHRGSPFREDLLLLERLLKEIGGKQ